MVDTRFDPGTFADLTSEADDFFGTDKPFWDQPLEARLAVSSSPSSSLTEQSDDLILQPKVGVWDRFVVLLKSKRSDPRNTQVKQSNENDCEFFDCASPPSEQAPSSYDELESVEF